MECAEAWSVSLRASRFNNSIDLVQRCIIDVYFLVFMYVRKNSFESNHSHKTLLNERQDEHVVQQLSSAAQFSRITGHSLVCSG